MRKLIAASLLAAFSFGSMPAWADGPVSLPQLAPGEVLLEVNGLGIVRTPASSAVVAGTLHGYGPGEAEAQRALEAEVQRITAAARAAGAGTGDITVDRVPVPNESLRIFEVTAPPAADTAEPPAPRQFGAQATVTVRLRNAARARELHARFGGEDPVMSYRGPQYVLEDEAPARRESRGRALAAARADAESYAAAAGMRIVRTLRITEREGFGFAGMTVTERSAGERIGMSWMRRSADPIVETIAVVGVDYVLAPR